MPAFYATQTFHMSGNLAKSQAIYKMAKRDKPNGGDHGASTNSGSGSYSMGPSNSLLSVFTSLTTTFLTEKLMAISQVRPLQSYESGVPVSAPSFPSSESHVMRKPGQDMLSKQRGSFGGNLRWIPDVLMKRRYPKATPRQFCSSPQSVVTTITFIVMQGISSPLHIFP